MIPVGKGEHLVLTTAVMADAELTEYWEGITPDFSVCSQEELLQTLTYWINE